MDFKNSIIQQNFEQGPSDDNLTADKKKVLKFFNEGGEQEMTGIQVSHEQLFYVTVL